MKIINLDGNVVANERGTSIEIRPDTVSPKARTLRVAIAREFNGELPQLADVGKVGKGMLMLFPTKNPNDNRFFIVGGFTKHGHRDNSTIDDELTTANILETSYGRGAWGAGVAFIATMTAEQLIVSDESRSGSRKVILVRDNQVVEERFTDVEFAQLIGETSPSEIL